MNYFQTFYRICTGTAVFQELYQTTGWRAFRHLLLTCVLGGMLFSVLTVLLWNGSIRRGAARFDAEFGAIESVNGALQPTRNPETARTLLLSPVFAVAYYPQFEEELPDAVPSGAGLGILWSREALWCWVRTGAHEIQLFPGAMAQWQQWIEKDLNLNRSVPIGQLGATLRQWRPAATGDDRVESTEPVVESIVLSDQITNLEWLFGTTFGVMWFMAMLLQALVFGGLFVLVFGLFGRGYSRLTRKQLWVTMIYAGFPAMLLGTVIQGLELGLAYNTVYVFGMIGYLLFVLARLERELNPERKRRKDDNDSDDSDLDF